MQKTVWTFGLISGVIVSLFMATSMITVANNPAAKPGESTMMLIGYLGMLIAFSLVFVAVKNVRDKQNNGVISFGKAFGMGLLIVLIASTLYVITWSLVHHYYMPDFMEKYMAAALEKAKATSTPEQLQKLTDQMNQQTALYKNPVFFTLFTYMEIIPVGVVVALLTAFLLKRKSKTPAAGKE